MPGRRARTKVKKTRPYRPQTNGKIERFHRTLLQEWAYIRPWENETQRADAYRGFLHYYNSHRTHGALNWNTPASTIGNNLPYYTLRRASPLGRPTRRTALRSC